jgi:hypothetical protein
MELASACYLSKIFWNPDWKLAIAGQAMRSIREIELATFHTV